MNKLDQMRRATRGYRHDRKGRSRKGERFVKLEHWMLKSEAWRSLTPPARALYVELAQRYNGLNNGEISMAVREAARLIHVAKDTVSKAFRELLAKGFIRSNVPGDFNWKIRHATTWFLTQHPVGDIAATKEFMRWSPAKSEAGTNSGTRCPRPGTGELSCVARSQTGWPWLGTLDLVFHRATVPNGGTHLVCHAMRRNERLHQPRNADVRAVHRPQVSQRRSHVGPPPHNR